MTTLELTLFKINGSERRKYDIKVSAKDFKNRILSSFSNYVLDVMMKPEVSFELQFHQGLTRNSF